jgi:hypothetical protein
MHIEFENDIKTEYSGYDNLIRILQIAYASADSTIIFDFSKVFFFEANLCAVLGTIIEILESNGKKIVLENFNNAVECIFR